MTVKETLIQKNSSPSAAAFGIGGNFINASKINAGNFDSLIESVDAFVKAIS